MLGQIKLVFFFIMLMGAGGGLWYVQHLKSENEILTLNNEKLEGAVADQQAVIEQQLADILQIQDINKELTEKIKTCSGFTSCRRKI